MPIEILEARIAPATLHGQVLSYTDLDGDHVKITISKGTLVPGDFTFATGAVDGDNSMPQQLTLLNLGSVSDIDGASIVTKVTRAGGGDGQVNIGAINAAGHTLSAVKIRGDLGDIDAGTGAGTALKLLQARSLGANLMDTGATDLESDIAGTLGKLKLTGSLYHVFVKVTGGDLQNISIGGSVLGGSEGGYAGAIYADGNVGRVVVKHDVVGYFSDFSGSIGAGKNMGPVTIGGSVLGNEGEHSAAIYCGFAGAGDMGAVTIRHDLRGGDVAPGHPATNTGVVSAPGKIASVTIGGSLAEDNAGDGGDILAGGDVGFIQIAGAVGDNAGGTGAQIDVGGKLDSLFIGGSIIGGFGATGRVVVHEFGHGVIRGDVAGSYGDGSGSMNLGVTGSLRIGGSLLGGAGTGSGEIRTGAIEQFVIAGSVVGGDDPDPEDMTAGANSAGSIEINGTAGLLKIGHGLRGGSGDFSGEIVAQELKNFALGGDVDGGAGESSGAVQAVKIVHGVIGGNIAGNPTGKPNGTVSAGAGGIGSLHVKGSIVGGLLTSNSGLVVSTGPIDSIVVGGDLRGGGTFAGPGSAPTDTGAIEAQRIGRVVIGGSIIAGPEISAPAIRSGAIVAKEDIGSVVVKGDLLGNANTNVEILAHGLNGDPVADNVAIGSVKIGGRVDHAWIFGGVDQDAVADNGNAQIGKVTVGGDWAASILESGCTSVDGTSGDGNDTSYGGGTDSKIGKVTIKGQVLGLAGSTATYGFFAETIGAFKYAGISVPLAPGPGTDTFAAGKAHAVGTSLSPSTAAKPDLFAVHVYEV